MKIMAVHAHPDDAEISFGGTLARLAQEGHKTYLLVCTNGSRGWPKDNTTAKAVILKTRAQEQAAAARILGLADHAILPFEDGELFDSLETRKEVTYYIRKWKPDILILPNPNGRYLIDGYINHPDHKAAGEIALYAYQPAAGNARFFPEQFKRGVKPHQINEVWISFGEKPNLFIDITATFPTKINALAAHASQLAGKMALKNFRVWVADWGRRAAKQSKQGMKYAEAFERIVVGKPVYEPSSEKKSSRSLSSSSGVTRKSASR